METIGITLKRVGSIILVLSIIAFITGIGMAASQESDIMLPFIGGQLISGSISAIILSLVLYGFGELINIAYAINFRLARIQSDLVQRNQEIGKKTCPRCGNSHGDKDAFCMRCGEKLSE